MRAPQVADFYTAAWPDFTPPLTKPAFVRAKINRTSGPPRVLFPDFAQPVQSPFGFCHPPLRGGNLASSELFELPPPVPPSDHLPAM
jgi:hypothetical protein